MKSIIILFATVLIILGVGIGIFIFNDFGGQSEKSEEDELQNLLDSYTDCYYSGDLDCRCDYFLESTCDLLDQEDIDYVFGQAVGLRLGAKDKDESVVFDTINNGKETRVVGYRLANSNEYNVDYIAFALEGGQWKIGDID